jgi:hypothetical protein
MKYNIVALDPSLISTALVISSGDTFKMYNYCRESSVFGKTGIKKWFKLAEEYVTYRFVNYRPYKDYSDGEITKLKDYDKVTDDIISDILANIDPKLPTKIGIEGFSYSSKNGDIIDLVTFSTLLRKKLFDKVSNDIMVLSPSTLKLESCRLTYPPIVTETGKKVKKVKTEHRNNLGLAGGSFTKTDIFLAIVENNIWDDYWTKHCKLVKSDVLLVSTIPKPYEDINDSFIIFKYLSNLS